MDDRIAEIREALANPGRFAMAPAVIWRAAKDYVDLLESDALIIRRKGIDYEAATKALIGLAKSADLYPTHSDNWRKRAAVVVNAAISEPLEVLRVVEP